jgi:putative ABC transport system substrate-binding protein
MPTSQLWPIHHVADFEVNWQLAALKRREFITLLAGAATAWPLAARAQQPAPAKRIGVLDINSAEYSSRYLAAFREGLLQLGYVEGQTVEIDYRHSNGDTGALTGLAEELIRLKPNVILATSTSPVMAIKRIAPTLPIVCPTFGEPFVPSLATSFAHPGGSVTGIATNVEGLVGKLTELTLDAVPGITRVGFLANPAGASMGQNERQIKSTAEPRGIAVRIEPVRNAGDIDGALHRLSEERVQAIIVPGNGLLNSQHKRIVELALALRLPLIFGERAGAIAGGLASYGVNQSENWRRAAVYIDKILRGAKPGDLPIEFPIKVELVVNLKTARALGLTLAPTLLARADEVIE